MKRENDILFEAGDYWVSREKKGFKVWKNGHVHSTLVATIGYEGEKGSTRAIEECKKRAGV